MLRARPRGVEREAPDADHREVGAGDADRRERIKPVIGDLAEPRLGISDETLAELNGKIDHFFHLAAIYDMTADEERNRVANVEGTRHAVELANALEAGVFHHASSIAAAGDVQGPVPRGHVRRGPEARSPLPPDQVRVREDRPHADHGAVAGLPARDRRRQLADRRDGQDRRAVLLLHRDQDGPALPARLVPARSAPSSATRTSSRSTTSPRRWITSRTSPRSTARHSTSATPSPSARAT